MEQVPATETSETAGNLRMFSIAAVILVLDQATKVWATRLLGYGDELEVLPGFFRLVHWQNTGAAWSLFPGKNQTLALISLAAVIALYFARRHFEAHTKPGQVALGFLFGGILGNLIDRFRMDHVIDFIYFYVQRRGGGEAGFPAFNVADSAITCGVGLLLWLSWQRERERDRESAGRQDSGGSGPAPTPGAAS